VRSDKSAAAFYLVAYFTTMLGAFGVVSVLSRPGGDLGDLEEHTGLFWRLLSKKPGCVPLHARH
jgi:NADH:ubiquinone oxidoreductase subunit 2 (subunit N)